MTENRTIAVLMGGWSNERSVSLASGRMSSKALREKGYNVVDIDVTDDLVRLVTDLKDAAPDVVFNALHGKGGEDGVVQGILDVMNIPYTHSGRLASAIAMDKNATKNMVQPKGVRCAKGKIVQISDFARGIEPMERPYVVKPNQEGSSVGVFIVKAGDNRDIAKEWQYGAEALVEQYIPGRELSVAVMQPVNENAHALTVTEIVANEEFYNFEAKYADGGSSHIVPAPIPADVFEEAKRMAVLAHEVLGCTGVSRSDFRYDDSKSGADGLYFLEINTQPGMTPTSLVPEQAQHLGISYPELVDWMVKNATQHG